jgi:hypothetical protein
MDVEIAFQRGQQIGREALFNLSLALGLLGRKYKAPAVAAAQQIAADLNAEDIAPPDRPQGEEGEDQCEYGSAPGDTVGR